MPGLFVAAWVLVGGTFGTFWFWVFRYAHEYSRSQTWADGAASLWLVVERAFPLAWGLWTLCVVGAALTAFRSQPLRYHVFLLGLLAFSFVGVSAGLYYRPHYFILVLPSAALFAGVVARCVEQGAARRGALRIRCFFVLALVGAGCAQSAWARREPYARAMQEEMTRETVAARPAYVVWARVRTSWLEQAGSERWIFAWAREYLSREYELVGQVRILTHDRSEYLWDDEAKAVPVAAVPTMLADRADVVGGDPGARVVFPQEPSHLPHLLVDVATGDSHPSPREANVARRPGVGGDAATRRARGGLRGRAEPAGRRPGLVALDRDVAHRGQLRLWRRRGVLLRGSSRRGRTSAGITRGVRARAPEDRGPRERVAGRQP